MRSASLLLAAVLLAGCSDGTPKAGPTPRPTSVATAPEPVDPLSPRPAVESPAPTAGSTCSARALTVQDADLLADEHRLEEVFAVRTSGPPCRLRGWPEVSLLGPGDAPLTVAVRRTGTAQAAGLGRSSSLSFVLGTPRRSDCEDVSALLVRLPGSSRWIRTATTMQVCHRELTISPVLRRQDDEGAEH